MAWPAVRSFALDESWGDALQLSVPKGRASLAPLFRGYNHRPCRSSPISPSSPTRCTPPSSGRPVTGARAPGAAGGPGNARGARRARRPGGRARRARGQVSRPGPRARPGRRQPHAHRAFPAGRSRARRPRPGRPWSSSFGPRPPGAARGTPHRGPAARRGSPSEDGPVIVRYRDPTQMGKVYLLPAGVERLVPGRGPGEMGPTPSAADLTLDAWRERIRRHPGELKNLLRNQAFVAGHRQCLLGRDPVRGAPPAVPEARLARARGGRRAVPRDARDARGVHRRSSASACRPRSRSRFATTSPCTTGAARRVRAAARGSPRSRRAGSRPGTAGAASADGRRPGRPARPRSRGCPLRG